MKGFNLLRGNKKDTLNVPIITKETQETYHIPIDLYRSINQLGVDLYRENMVLFSPIEFNLSADYGEQITYLYKIDNITPYFNMPDRIVIEYSIKFPATQEYCEFLTSERLSLYE